MRTARQEREKRKNILLVLLAFLLAVSVILPKVEFTATVDSPAPFYLENTPLLTKKGNLVAVRMQDELVLGGIIARVGVDVRSGDGKISVAFPPFAADVSFMKSAYLARSAAEKETTYSFNAVDVVVYFENLSEFDVLEGPSASATISILMIAAVENKSVNESYVVSAEIAADGRLRPVGGVEEKWAAAKRAGLSLVVASTQPEELPNLIKVSSISELADLILLVGEGSG